MSGGVGMARWLLSMAERLACLLEPAEREAVLGDLTESGETGGRVLRGVVGLTFRRQAALWRSWRLCLSLVGLVVPLGVLLSVESRRAADGGAISIWFFADNWDWHLLGSAGFWHGFGEAVPGLCLTAVALVCWSWTSGFLIASVMRRAAWSNGTLFFLVLLGVGLLGMPQAFGHSLALGRARDFEGNAAVFATGFYRVLFPLIVQVTLILLPALWGMRYRLRLGDLSLSQKVVLWGFGLAAVFTLATECSAWWQVRTWTVYPSRLPLLPSLLPLAVLGPAGYWLATANLQWRQRRKAVSA